MTPSPPVWIRLSRIPCPSGERTLLTSTVESPVTQTADVAIKKASIQGRFCPGMMLAGSRRAHAPSRMTTRKE